MASLKPRVGILPGRKIEFVVCLFAFTIFISACGPEQLAVKKAVSSVTVQIPLEAVKIEKPIKVSFSTYSKEWPVGWQWIDPDEKSNPTPRDVKKGVLRIKVPTKKDLYGENRTAPRYLKAITGDFQIVTRVKFLPKENYQGAGLLISQDDNNYMRFERAYGGVGGGGEGIRIDIRTGGEYQPIVTPDTIQTGIDEVELKIIRSGKFFTAYWREGEDFEWLEAGKYESGYPETILAGLVACNTAREITAEFAYIRLLPNLKK